jgi:hypothetical protein
MLDIIFWLFIITVIFLWSLGIFAFFKTKRITALASVLVIVFSIIGFVNQKRRDTPLDRQPNFYYEQFKKNPNAVPADYPWGFTVDEMSRFDAWARQHWFPEDYWDAFCQGIMVLSLFGAIYGNICLLVLLYNGISPSQLFFGGAARGQFTIDSKNGKIKIMS